MKSTPDKWIIKYTFLFFLILSTLLFSGELKAQDNFKDMSQKITAIEAEIQSRSAAIEQKMIAWRRDIHENPELGDFETRTAALVEKHLRSLGLEVSTGIARTGIVALLRGGKPGKCVALRADMDALPIKEPEGLSFASKATVTIDGKKMDVMHACGHDAHTAMLMATAEVLTSMKKNIPGTVMFIFQPAEEGSHTPGATTWGAKMMLEEGIFKKDKPDAVFGLHVMMGKSGEIFYKSGATTASSDILDIVVNGKGGHGGMPWSTSDPVPTAASIILGLQTVVSRKADLTASPAVITIGTIQGGTSQNIIPENVKMTGTIRAYQTDVQQKMIHDIKQMAKGIAEGAGQSTQIKITPNYPVTINNADLATKMLPVLNRVTDNKVSESPLQGASEDFSFYANEVPGLYIFLGVTKKGADPATAAPNHNPGFFIEESALIVGVKAMSAMAVNFLIEADD